MESIILDKNYVSNLIPRRSPESNKGTYGRVFIVSGSIGMTGSGSLSAKAALRTGAGLVYLGIPEKLLSIYAINVPESIQIPLPQDNEGVLTKESIEIIASKLENMNVLAIGPGMTSKNDVKEIVNKVLSQCKSPMVIDADGLNVIREERNIFSSLKNTAVITPHPGEMARLTGISIEEIQNNREKIALSYAKKTGVITVLKGNNTVIASPSGEIYINPTGNPGMATAGTGDVLTGIISALIAQTLSPLEAALAGTYIHGTAGDIAAKEKGYHGLIAGDVIENIPMAIKEILL